MKRINMENKLKKSQRIIFMGIIIIALGIVLSTTLAEKVGAIGTVLIAVGGLFFIAGMSRKKQEEEIESQEEKSDNPLKPK